MAARKYKPGTPKRYKSGGGRFTDRREMWTKLDFMEVAMFRQPVEEGHEEQGEGISIFLRPGNARPLTVKLTAWTRDELEAFRTVVNKALDEAAPICTRRDEIAQKAFEAGDDSFARIYRPVPQVFERERKKPEHDEGIQG